MAVGADLSRPSPIYRPTGIPDYFVSLHKWVHEKNKRVAKKCPGRKTTGSMPEAHEGERKLTVNGEPRNPLACKWAQRPSGPGYQRARDCTDVKKWGARPGRVAAQCDMIAACLFCLS